jgi:hypothetical protein
MTDNDLNAPVSEDDFPEFSQPPRHKPPVDELEEPTVVERAVGGAQDEVDDVLARLRRERAERRR